MLCLLVVTKKKKFKLSKSGNRSINLQLPWSHNPSFTLHTSFTPNMDMDFEILIISGSSGEVRHRSVPKLAYSP